MKAIVSKPQDATSIVIVSRNDESRASIMLRSDVMTANEQGFIQTEKRVGWIKGTKEEIQKLASNLKEGDDFSVKCFPVKLVIKETTSPAYANHEPKINPKTQEVITHLGAPVYRQTFVVSEASSDVDCKLITDKVTATIEVEAENSGFETSKNR